MPSAIAESSAHLPKPRGRPFTKQNAAQMAARAHSSRNLPPVALTDDFSVQPSVDPFVRECLVTVRAQLKRIFLLLQTETDPNKIDRLASAQAKLAEQERQLAGRPLPGSLRPNAPTKRTMFDAQERTPARKSAPAVEQPADTDRAEQE